MRSVASLLATLLALAAPLLFSSCATSTPEEQVSKFYSGAAIGQPVSMAGRFDFDSETSYDFAVSGDYLYICESIEANYVSEMHRYPEGGQSFAYTYVYRMNNEQGAFIKSLETFPSDSRPMSSNLPGARFAFFEQNNADTNSKFSEFDRNSDKIFSTALNKVLEEGVKNGKEISDVPLIVKMAFRDYNSAQRKFFEDYRQKRKSNESAP